LKTGKGIENKAASEGEARPVKWCRVGTEAMIEHRQQPTEREGAGRAARRTIQPI